MKQKIELRTFNVTVPTADGNAVAKRVPVENVPMEWDADINEWIITPEGMKMIEDAKAHHMGLLLPHELLALRKRLKLTQKEIGDLLQIGAKTWTRWETGKAYPSRSINLLIRTLNDGLLKPSDFAKMREPCEEPVIKEDCEFDLMVKTATTTLHTACNFRQTHLLDRKPSSWADSLDRLFDDLKILESHSAQMRESNRNSINNIVRFPTRERCSNVLQMDPLIPATK